MRLLMSCPDLHNTLHLGWLRTPRSRESITRIVESGLPWACDNGAFGGFDPDPFLRMLDSIVGSPRLMWVACPDVVADWQETAALFDQWHQELRDRSLPIALVAQDGLQADKVPWTKIDALFIGGSTSWKLGPSAAALVSVAKAHSKLVHMGRVNSIRRLRYAAMLGCDSVDGSGWSRFRDKLMPLADRTLAEPVQYGLESILMGGNDAQQ